jgi:hypothetical protein
VEVTDNHKHSSLLMTVKGFIEETPEREGMHLFLSSNQHNFLENVINLYSPTELIDILVVLPLI